VQGSSHWRRNATRPYKHFRRARHRLRACAAEKKLYLRMRDFCPRLRYDFRRRGVQNVAEARFFGTRAVQQLTSCCGCFEKFAAEYAHSLIMPFLQGLRIKYFDANCIYRIVRAGVNVQAWLLGRAAGSDRLRILRCDRRAQAPFARTRLSNRSPSIGIPGSERGLSHFHTAHRPVSSISGRRSRHMRHITEARLFVPYAVICCLDTRLYFRCSV
jgi:hypothetical protein